MQLCNKITFHVARRLPDQDPPTCIYPNFFVNSLNLENGKFP